MNYKIDDLTNSSVVALLEEHLQEMHLHSPAESVHALDIKALQQTNITFWSVWSEDKVESSRLLACGAIKKINDFHAELKSMRVASRYQGQGIANNLLNYLLKQAYLSGYQRLSLETGTMQAFRRARNLYQKHGFTYCEPFADYVEDPNSVFMTKLLSSKI